MLNSIGEGAFSSVNEAKDIQTGVKVAVKVIRRNAFYRRSEGTLDVLKEVAIMKDLVHVCTVSPRYPIDIQ